MSAVFKNAKKKLSQLELRKLMNDHKGKIPKDVKKIDSPLAKYNEQGQLTCILCKSVVRSEAVWTVHINAKQHKQNVETAKKLKERTNNFTVPLKRPLSPPRDVPEKRPRGILKNSAEATSVNLTIGGEKLPQDFFDNKKAPGGPVRNGGKREERTNHEQSMETDEVLPEGFFDDPKLDAKARNQEYKDPQEEEWEKFMKVIKEADNQSAAIIAEDQDESTTERQIDEIDEQMKKLSRVLDLEKKKVEIISVSSEVNRMETSENEDEDVNESEFDEFGDWRAKKSFR